MVESDFIEVKCYKNLDTTHEVRLRLRRTDSIAKVCKWLHDKFSVLESQLSRIWTSTYDGKLKLLELNQTVEEAGLHSLQVIMLEIESFGHWLPKSKILEHIKKLNFQSRESPSGICQPPEISDEFTKNIINTNRHSSDTTEDDLSSKFKKITLNINYGSKMKNAGLCGLINLGNTCYMNSVLQCLSNCRQLTEYFLNNTHMYEMNKNNPLGMDGEVARKYGDLIQNMWSGENVCLKPFHLKAQICRFNSQFRGWTQHDAQEFLSFLLDGLHEDLNRACKKPMNDKDGFASKHDLDQQQSTLESYKMKNDSVIVDTFHGSLKSRVICPKCERLSVTIDPFSTLSLPLPLHKNKQVKVHFVPNDASDAITTFEVAVPHKGVFRDLLIDISRRTDVNESLLIPAAVTDYHIERIFTPQEKLSALREDDEIFVYEVSQKANDSGFSIVPVCFWNVKSTSDKIRVKHGFGIPLLLTFKKFDLKAGKVGICVLEYIRNRFNLEESKVPDMYVIDLSNRHFADSVELEFSEDGTCMQDVIRLLEFDGSDKIFGRKMLFVNVLLTGGESFFGDLSSENVGWNGERHSGSKNVKLTIYDCLDMFTSFEKLGAENSWYCPSCKSQQRATKKFDLWTTPRILILHLKRFSYSNLGDKLEVPIDFPLSNLNLARYVTNPRECNLSYDLVGVINHFGTLSGGHYTATCRNPYTGSWYDFNDESVSPIEPTSVPSHSAYVLFYSRNEAES